jgi:hypothetical protein
MPSGSGRRLSESEHRSRPWRIHEIAPDFQLEDVWALPTPGGPDDFPRLVAMATRLDPSRGESRVARALLALREGIGGLLGWDRDASGLDSRVDRLRDRLPDDLRSRPLPQTGALPFEPVYMTDDELALELANQTVHGVLHLGWVPDGEGGWRGQMAILVKPNGLLGRAYMLAITPFRHTIVYPALLRDFGRAWERR